MLEGVAPSQGQLGDMFYGRVVPMKYSLCLAIMCADLEFPARGEGGETRPRLLRSSGKHEKVMWSAPRL